MRGLIFRTSGQHAFLQESVLCPACGPDVEAVAGWLPLRSQDSFMNVCVCPCTHIWRPEYCVYSETRFLTEHRAKAGGQQVRQPCLCSSISASAMGMCVVPSCFLCGCWGSHLVPHTGIRQVWLAFFPTRPSLEAPNPPYLQLAEETCKGADGLHS